MWKALQMLLTERYIFIYKKNRTRKKTEIIDAKNTIAKLLEIVNILL